MSSPPELHAAARLQQQIHQAQSSGKWQMPSNSNTIRTIQTSSFCCFLRFQALSLPRLCYTAELHACILDCTRGKDSVLADLCAAGSLVPRGFDACLTALTGPILGHMVGFCHDGFDAFFVALMEGRTPIARGDCTGLRHK